MASSTEVTQSNAAEEEIVDPLSIRREKCQQEPKCAKLKLRLDKCTNRVTNAKETDETCFEEIIDYVNCVDHCAMHGLFSKLK